MKILLFFLSVCFAQSVAAFGQSDDNVGTVEWMKQLEDAAAKAKIEQSGYMQDLIERSKDIQHAALGVTDAKKGAIHGQLYVFITLGMKEKNIQQLMEESRRYGGVLVIRGLYKDSMRETVQYIARFIRGDDGGIIIDPTLFRKYKIEQVPAFVLTQGEKHDVLYGNVLPEFALGEFAKNGDLKAEAERLLLQ